MARGRRRKSSGKKSRRLRGGVGDQPPGSPFATLDDLVAAEAPALDAEMSRLAVERPTVLAGIERRMKVKEASSLQQIADSLLAAAMQHRAAPDAGSRLYGLAFSNASPEVQSRLLGALDAADAQIVADVFGDATSLSPDTTSEARARSRARRAIEDGGLETIESVDVAATRERVPDDSELVYLEGASPDNTSVVTDPEGWSQEQIRRGYRSVVEMEGSPKRGSQGGGSSVDPRVSEQIELMRGRIESAIRATDTDYYFRIEAAPAAEKPALIQEKQAILDTLRAQLDDDSVRNMARQSIIDEAQQDRRRLAELAEQADNTDLWWEYIEKKGLVNRREDELLAAFDRQPAASTAPSETAAPTAPVRRFEILEDRLDEFTFDPPEGGVEPNPNFGETRRITRYRPEFEADANVVERIAPSDIEQLSEPAAKALAQAQEIIDSYVELARYDPDFPTTRRGEAMTSALGSLMEAHPEIDSFIDNRDLSSRQMPAPRDVFVPEGRNALPEVMRLRNYIDSDTRQKYRLAEQSERRTGIYKDIPPDAPNRLAWILLQDVEEANRLGITVDSLRAQRRATKRGKAAPPRERATRTEVVLPTPPEIAEKEFKKSGGARENLSFGPDEPARLTDKSPAAGFARDPAEIDAEFKAARERERTQKNPGPAAPVEDLTQDPNYFYDPREVKEELLPGSGGRTAKSKKRDDDLALREGKSYVDKMREKIFRMVNEYVDPDMLATSGNGGISVGELGGPGQTVDAVDSAAAAMSDAFDSSGDVKKSAAASGGDRLLREASLTEVRAAPLNLDSLMPIWRGFMQFPEGQQIVTRRPTAREVAGFILDLLDLPDPGMAARLEPHVQASMNILEAVEPTTDRAKRASGTVFQPSDQYRRAMEADVQSRRQPTDQRNLYDEQSLLASEQEALAKRQQYGDGGVNDDQFVAEADYVPEDAPPPTDDGFVPEGDSGSDFVPEDQFEDVNAELDQAAQERRSMFPDPTKPLSIAGLIALAGGAAAGSAQAQSPDSNNPVEYLAMARKPRRSAAQVLSEATGKSRQAKTATSKGKGGAKTAPADADGFVPDPSASTTAGGAAPDAQQAKKATAKKSAAKRTRGKQSRAQQAAEQQAAAQQAGAEAVDQQVADTPPPKPPTPFPYDPVYQSARGLVNLFRNPDFKNAKSLAGYIPSILSMLGAGAGTYTYNALNAEPEPDPGDPNDLNAGFEDLFQSLPQERPSGPNPPMGQPRFDTDIDLPFGGQLPPPQANPRSNDTTKVKMLMDMMNPRRMS